MARIMIVDDTGAIRALLKNYLTKAGHIVVCQAEDGMEAIFAYQKYKPDIVTMDLSMPHMGGIAALQKILEFDNKAKVIVISAAGEKELVIKALSAGAVQYVLKPIDENKLLAVINKVIQPVI